MTSEHAIAKRMTLAYLAGLTLVAVLSSAVHFLLDNIIVQQQDAATIINVAGRQRMLSQRIALLASDFRTGDLEARALMLDAVATMERAQDALISGGDLGITRGLSATAREMYFDGPDPLDPKVRAYLADARELASDTPNAARAYHRLTRAARSDLLPDLDSAVQLFETEAQDEIAWMRTAQSTVLISLLVTLALEAVFIFHPLVRMVRRHAARLYEMATRDALTNLPNRRHFMETAERQFAVSQRMSQPLAALVLDLDHFKQINDIHGHSTGDAVLRHFAEVATRALRSGDMLSRTGGEEFALMLPLMSRTGALTVAEKLRAAIEAEQDDTLPPVTVSVGVSVTSPTDRALDEVLRRADKALYSAKSAGRNRVALHLAE
ncbi:diguanylate cyclase [Paroceanicella profunda]|uniref:diguanylate cyclase n=1 Tax=Paroceanicella profunda TaxID=2579971 RepID=A0A5B8G1N7_9RHOB|nr:diguanylate cyclase [Paroceanicella profunda]QDL93012.1 diguanylate cyclase [Paroceanicella profunda]